MNGDILPMMMSCHVIMVRETIEGSCFYAPVLSYDHGGFIPSFVEVKDCLVVHFARVPLSASVPWWKHRNYKW